MPAPVGNRNAEKIGHRSAIDALRRGDDFRGLAAEKLRDVTQIYFEAGPDPLMENLALMTTATAFLWSDALRAAVDDGSHDKLDRYSKTFGQLAEKAFKMLAEIQAKNADAIDAVIDAATQAAREMRSGKD